MCFKFSWNGWVLWQPCFLRNRQSVFQSGCTTLYRHQEWTGIPVSLLFYFLLFILFDSSHPGGCEAVSQGVLICVFWLTNDVVYLFTFEKVCSGLFTILKVARNSLYSLDSIPDIPDIPDISPHSVYFLFTFLTVSFAPQRFLVLMKCSLSIWENLFLDGPF